MTRCHEMFARYRAEIDDIVAWAQAHGDKQVVFTEFGQLRSLGAYDFCECQDLPESDYRAALMEEFVPYLDSLDQVAGYAWFATVGDSCRLDARWCECCKCGLVRDGALTELGELYAEGPGTTPTPGSDE